MSNLGITVADRERTILIIDDYTSNLGVIADYLEEDGFDIMVAQDGESGLQKAQIGQPNIILLDVMMPGIDGFETCRRLKEDKRTKDIPVIFMTALINVEDKIKGFEVGGVDYVTKPVQQAEVLARINLHLRLYKLTQWLQQSNQELFQALEDLNMTQAQLIESEKMAALGRVVAGVAHEINTPLGVAVTAASALMGETKSLSAAYERDEMTQAQFEEFLETGHQSTRLILSNLERAAGLVQSFKKVAVDQSSETKRVFGVRAYLEEILLSLKPRLRRKIHHVEVNCEEHLKLNSYPGAFSQVVTNLVINSIIHGYEPEQVGHLTFRVEGHSDRVVVEYQDDGCGIDKNNLQKIFEPFFTTRRADGGSGLGLHITFNLVTQKLGGTIRCESEPGKGTKFIVELPLEIK